MCIRDSCHRDSRLCVRRDVPELLRQPVGVHDGPNPRKANEFRMRSTEGSGSGTSPSERARERRARTIEPRRGAAACCLAAGTAGCAYAKWPHGVGRVFFQPSFLSHREKVMLDTSRRHCGKTLRLDDWTYDSVAVATHPRRARRSASDRGSHVSRCSTLPRASPLRQSPPAAG